MEYILSDSPISKNRVIKPLNRWQKLHAQKKRERLQEEFSSEELIQMGFYEHSIKQRPYGVEVVQVVSEKMDANWYELRRIPKCQIRVLLPSNSSQARIQKLAPRYHQETDSYYWSYQIYGGAIMWVTLDFLSRLIQLYYWDYCESVPLYWNFGNEKAKGMLEKYIPSINNGTFALNIPIPVKIEDSELEYLVKRAMQLRIKGNQETITNKAKTSFLRHHYTPYDYLWQTSKMDRDGAKALCNQLIKKKYLHLNET